MSIATFVNILVGVLVAVLGFTIMQQKAILEAGIVSLKMELREMREKIMTKELCQAGHAAHDIIHGQISRDLNGLGQKVAGIDKRVIELEKIDYSGHHTQGEK
jgi:hypothetical protein